MSSLKKDMKIIPTIGISDKLYNSLSSLVGDEKITTDNIVSIATNLMQIVDTYPELKGVEKKSMIMHVLKRFVRDRLDGDVENTVIMFIDLLLPSVIDTIVSVDKKEIVVKIHKSLKSCFSCC